MDRRDIGDIMFDLWLSLIGFLFGFWFISTVCSSQAYSPPKILIQILEFFHLSPALAWEPLVLAVSVGILVALFFLLMTVIRRWYRQRQLEAEREEWVSPPPEIKPLPRLFLRELTLMIESREAGRRVRRLGRWVNLKEVLGVRPVALVEVNDKSLIGRILPLSFELVDPNGRTRYECSLKATLIGGKNRILPLHSEFLILSKRLPRGRWQIRLYLGDHPWGQIGFLLMEKADGMIRDVVGPDAELKPRAEEQIETLGGLVSIDEILED